MILFHLTCREDKVAINIRVEGNGGLAQKQEIPITLYFCYITNYDNLEIILISIGDLLSQIANLLRYKFMCEIYVFIIIIITIIRPTAGHGSLIRTRSNVSPVRIGNFIPFIELLRWFLLRPAVGTRPISDDDCSIFVP